MRQGVGLIKGNTLLYETLICQYSRWHIQTRLMLKLSIIQCFYVQYTGVVMTFKFRLYSYTNFALDYRLLTPLIF